ncbi:MAG: hypothetical protein HYV68_03335 [Candidatus Taylorbacteria bacterium]|nr:hypothetical protein [Candidatus Taylorbacteria bacterium]
MSSQFKFRLAETAEDAAIRAVLRQSPMAGNISLAFGREPSFFIAEKAGSMSNQTLIYQDQTNGKIVGIGSRCIRKLFVDGVEKPVGYLSNLRLLPEARNGMTLVRGYKFLQSLHSDGAVPYYFTTILDENTPARATLESGRAGMPKYRYIGTLATYLITIRKPTSSKLPFEVRLCRPNDLPQAHKCLSEWNRRHQFAPVYTPGDISGESGLLPGFSLRNFYICEDKGEIVGTLGVWNQRAFKQTVVASYSATMKVVRLFSNGIARLRGRPILPPIGDQIRLLHGAVASSRDDDPEVFGALIAKARADWSGYGHDYLVIAFSQGHTLETVTSRMAARVIKSRIYLVSWPEANAVLPETQRIPHLEVATL